MEKGNKESEKWKAWQLISKGKKRMEGIENGRRRLRRIKGNEIKYKVKGNTEESEKWKAWHEIEKENGERKKFRITGGGK